MISCWTNGLWGLLFTVGQDSTTHGEYGGIIHLKGLVWPKKTKDKDKIKISLSLGIQYTEWADR